MTISPNVTTAAHLYSTKNLLRQRGLDLASEGTLSSTLLSDFADIDDFYQSFKLSEFRKRYRAKLNESNVGHSELKFAKSFEWYVSEILRREFGFLASSFSVQIDGSPSGTDFDVIGFGLNLCIHIECKTGNPNNLDFKTADNFLKKCRYLSADINVLYIDTSGLDPDDHSFLKAIHTSFLQGTSNCLYKISKPGMQIYQVGFEPTFIIDTNKSSKSAIKNLQEIFYTCLRSGSQLRALMGISPEKLQEFGYDVEKVL